jgi:hypothetical protein
VVSCNNSLEFFLKKKLGEIWQLVFWKEKKNFIFFGVKFSVTFRKKTKKNKKKQNKKEL